MEKLRLHLAHLNLLAIPNSPLCQRPVHPNQPIRQSDHWTVPVGARGYRYETGRILMAEHSIDNPPNKFFSARREKPEDDENQMGKREACQAQRQAE